MRRTVGANQTAAIDREHHREVLDRDVMNQLVVTALQEGRIDRADRLEAFARKAGGERHGMLFGDADIKVAIRKTLREFDQPRALRSEEHTSELQSLMRISYAVFCLN